MTDRNGTLETTIRTCKQCGAAVLVRWHEDPRQIMEVQSCQEHQGEGNKR